MTNSQLFPPIFATNRPGSSETVASAVNFLLEGVRTGYAQPANLALATAYINPQGFALIADEVEQAPCVRILLGAEPEEASHYRSTRGTAVSFEEVAEAHLAGLRIERDLVGFDAEADASARRLVEWLRSTEGGTIPKVEVRRYTKGFLHGKAFIAEHPMMPAVLAGSSNLTLAGLSWNRELNLGYPAGQHTGLVINWFNDLWEDSDPYDLAEIYEARWKAHAPWTIFLRMLHELYGANALPEGVGRVGLPTTEFQTDGILRALRILDELGGVLVCDEVGLGKTFIAGEIIRRVSQITRQKVLIVVPASLKKSTWTPFLKKFDLVSARVDVITFDELRLGRDPITQNLDDYALVVIDEAHNLRNSKAQRAEKVMELLWTGNPKKVVLLTATPVNNSLKDLHTLVSYFVRNDAQFTAIGIPSIAQYIGDAQKMDPDSLSPEHLFDLMDKVAVRRTRRFIKREYANDLIRNNQGDLVPIEFPTPVVERLTYDLDPEAEKVMEAMIYALEVGDDEDLVIRSGTHRDNDRLSLARYAPSLYSVGNDVDALQVMNVGLLRSALLKRLESSSAALVATLGRLVASHEAFVSGLDAGYVMTGDALRGYANSETDTLEEFLEELDGKALDQVSPVADYDVKALRKDVVGDVDLLKRLYAMAEKRWKASPDAKVVELLEHLTEIAEEAERLSALSSADRRKVIIFSTYSDTVDDLHDKVARAIASAPKASPLSKYKGRVASPIYGARNGNGQDERSTVIAGFAPVTAGELKSDGTPLSKDEYDILITTDVLAEGVNLQQAGRMVNFDLPWNPMRLVQRHGRIDRIGSQHKKVKIGCFFPADSLDKLLGLEATLQRKIAYANAAIGAGEVIPGQKAIAHGDVLFHDERRMIEALFNEDPVLLVEGGDSGALSGEEYRRRLQRALREPLLREEVLGLPYGSGSGFMSRRVNQSGYVFCVKIGHHETPWFRFVACDSDTWDVRYQFNNLPWIEDDTLKCLVASDPGDNELTQVISEAAQEKVFEAWKLARKDVFEEWSKLTDPANIEPRIEKALREAIDIVSKHAGVLSNDEQMDLVGRLNGRWEHAIVREIRNIVRNQETTNAEKVQLLKGYVADAGLPMPQKPEPLPVVNIDEVRVICWMAVGKA